MTINNEKLLESYAIAYGKYLFDSQNEELKNELDNIRWELLDKLSKYKLSLPLNELVVDVGIVKENNDQDLLADIHKKLLEMLENSLCDNATKMEAHLILIVDNSGSMGVFEKYIAECFGFWIERILKSIYHNVDISYIVHCTEAKLVDRETFYYKGESGGTIVSSGYKLVNEHINDIGYEDKDIFVFHISDGDNLTSDCERCIRYIKDLTHKITKFGYLEVNQYCRNSTLMHKCFGQFENEKVKTFTLREKIDLLDSLKTLI
jgi:hypothetical protein